MALKTPKPPPRSRPAGGIRHWQPSSSARPALQSRHWRRHQRGNLLPAPPYNHDTGDVINAATYCPPRPTITTLATSSALATFCPPRPTTTTLATSPTALATFCPPRLPFRRHTSPQRNTLLYMSDSSLSPARTQVVEGGCEPHRGSSPHVDHITEVHLLM
jgi:hypothetical protein